MSKQSKHARIQSEIVAACIRLGYQTKKEFQGDGWRADVFATKSSQMVAFEIQLSPQSLDKTLLRQSRYDQIGASCCWLFQKPPHALTEDRPDLPIFYVFESQNGMYCVSLSGRNLISLPSFVEQYLCDGIKFARSARTAPDQILKLIFYEMRCWKCGATNHLFCKDGVLRAACNAEIRSDEELWESKRLVHRPEIIAAARKYISSPDGSFLNLGEIKPRYSKTVGKSYISFGCHTCDSIFGDWFVSNEELSVLNGYGQVASFEVAISLDPPIELPIPHWCYPLSGDFCG